jgi:hypothetical protein
MLSSFEPSGGALSVVASSQPRMSMAARSQLPGVGGGKVTEEAADVHSTSV